MKMQCGIRRSKRWNKKTSSTPQLQISQPTPQENVHVDDDNSLSSKSDSDATIPYLSSNSLGPSSPRDPSSSSSKSPIRKTKLLFDVYERCSLAIMEPKFFYEASKHVEWMSAMQEDIKMIKKNDTWELVERLPHRKVIGVKWVYKIKLNSDGSINKLKARLVAKDYAQEIGVDYIETFAPMTRHDIIRILIALAAQKQLPIF